MLWYKGWLETRIRLLFMLGLVGFFLVFAHLTGWRPGPAGATPGAWFAMLATTQMVVISSMLAGAGIATQPPFQAAKGLPGSTLFTLSLPVTRFRLLAVRASLGWLEMAAGIGALCFGMWLGTPWLRGTVTVVEIFEYVVTLIACSSALYSISVLLSTFLEEQWRIQGSFIAFAVLWWLPNHTPLPAAANIFRAMGTGSPMIAHAMPWPVMGVSLALAAMLLFAALKIVQAREY